MNNTYIPSADTLVKRDITVQQFFDFVKQSDTEKLDELMSLEPSTLYYLNKFTKYGHRRFFLSLNVPALYFSTIWLSYRKQYLMAVLQMLLPLLYFVLPSIMYLEPNLFSNDVVVQQGSLYVIGFISLVLFFITNIVLLFSQNAIYLGHVRRCILKGKYYKKGVSKTGPIIISIISIILTGVVSINMINYIQKYQVNKQLTQSVLNTQQDDQ